ncbi:type IV pilus modification protein PilV [Marinibactrum halimedae]|nr:type IV pilus modification protein PilV [Marinibactrum halimedae]MCD9459510.1 type IV pilus modification protein PilV [Marinibactrum halimedae]
MKISPLNSSVSSPLKHHQTGASLIEVLVAFLIMSVGFAGIISLQANVVKESFDTNQRSHAMWVAQELIERIKANTAGVDSYVSASEAVSCDDEPEIMCATYYDGSEIKKSTQCNSAEIAIYDVWELTCGHSSDDTDQSSLSSILLTGVSVERGGKPRSLNVEVSWSAKSVLDQVRKENRNITDEDAEQSIQSVMYF